MRPRALWDLSYYVAKAFQFLFGIVGAVMPTSERIPLDKVAQYSILLSNLVAWAQSNAWWATPTCLAIAGIATFVMKWIGEPWAWQMACGLVDGFRNQIFKSKKSDPVHHHRVTLFKCRRWCFTRKYKRLLFRPPWDRWLHATVRSGHTTLKNRPAFAIPDDGKVEGIAGEAWSARGTIYKTNLTQLNSFSSSANVEKYAEKTSMDAIELELRVRDGEEFARSYCAFPIETEVGEIWGVIVVDSRDPVLLSENQITGLFFPVAKCLTKLVSRL